VKLASYWNEDPRLRTGNLKSYTAVIEYLCLPAVTAPAASSWISRGHNCRARRIVVAPADGGERPEGVSWCTGATACCARCSTTSRTS